MKHEGFIWEIDEFLGVNQGLIVAEIELQNENQKFDKPSWIGEEVSSDPRYYNSNLVVNPFTTWKKVAISSEYANKIIPLTESVISVFYR